MLIRFTRILLIFAAQPTYAEPALPSPLQFCRMSDLRLITRDTTPIRLNSGELSIDTISAAVSTVNDQLHRVQQKQRYALDVFDVIDLRMLSGFIGELFVTSLSTSDPRLQRNPNIDGYPDLCDVSHNPQALVPADCLHYEFGGIEVKNTFGLKKSGTALHAREARRGRIQNRLIWKAHHRRTNHLLALQSDFVDRVPQIVSAFFSSELEPDDWTEKQNPKSGSTMTSFCQTRRSAFDKLQRRQLVVDLNWLNS